MDSTDGDRRYGLAVDVGTTSVALLVVDLDTKEDIASSSFLNPQTKFGLDVLSRLSYSAEDASNLSELGTMLRSEMNTASEKLLREAGLNPAACELITIAGNTIMEYLFLGISPQSLFEGSTMLLGNARRTFAPMDSPFPKTPAIFLPCISLYLGGDVAGGIEVLGLDKEGPTTLFVDIGTNGEIVLRYEGNLYATSAAAGPALEGASIQCGQRATSGAIEHVSLDVNNEVDFTTIGGAEPTGICGSGLIDLIAALLERGDISSSGNLLSAYEGAFKLSDSVLLSQKDIRQFQLAKGAIAAGIFLLCEKASCPIDEIEQIIISGAFGSEIDPDSLKTVGLIPVTDASTITFAGNTSLQGARAALLDPDVILAMESLRGKTHVVNLAKEPNFQEVFMRELEF